MWLFSFLLVSPAFADTPVDLSQEGARWQKVLEGVTESVVALRVDITRGFDTNSARSTLATGFVVDAERGLILTNRHVVQPGPIVARRPSSSTTRRFRVEAVYRDPVHDFGFLRFDPEGRPLPPSAGDSAPPGSRARRRRDPRRRERRGREDLDPRGHARAARPQGARLRAGQLQRLQHVLLPGRIVDLGRVVGLARRRHHRRRDRAERGRAARRGVAATTCRSIASCARSP